MRIKFFDHKILQSLIPRAVEEGGDWYRTWSGYYKGRSFHSKVHAAASVKASKLSSGNVVDSFNESEFEDFCELTIIEKIKKEEMVFVELGAGPGNQSIDVSGMVDYHLCNTGVKKVRCYAVEAEPTHFRWLQDTFRYNKFLGHTLFGAISDKIGWGTFDTSRVPEDNYGQALCKNGGTPVPLYTVDYLMEAFHIECIDLLHMDVQGEEFNALQGASSTIKAGKIDYIIECPHTVELGVLIKDFLDPYYECVINMPTWSGLHDVGLPKLVNMPQDGIQVFVRRGLIN